MRKRVRTHLEFEHFGKHALAAFAVEVGARSRCRPDGAALPACIRIVDSPVDILGEESHGIGDAQTHELAVDQREKLLATIGRGDRHVLPEAERVVEIDPDIISVIGAALLVDPTELWAGEAVERPALKTLFASRGLRSLQRRLAFAAIEACEMSAREHGPDDAVEIDVEPARAERAFRRLENLGDRGMRWIITRNKPHEQAWLIDPGESRTHRLAPDRVTAWIGRDSVERGLHPFVFVGIDRCVHSDIRLALAGAGYIRDRGGPALRLDLVARCVELLGVHPSDDAAIGLRGAEPQRIVWI